MAMDISALWEEHVSKFLEDSNDIVKIHYKPVRSGVSTRFDSLYQEGTDPANPNIIGVSESVSEPQSVSGKVHLDLYGASIGNEEGNKQLYIGRFSEYDALFSCLLSAVKTSASGFPITTKFDDANYVVVNKDGRVYDVAAVKTRGMGAVPFIVDVFLKASNKSTTTTTSSSTSTSTTSSSTSTTTTTV